MPLNDADRPTIVAAINAMAESLKIASDEIQKVRNQLMNIIKDIQD